MFQVPMLPVGKTHVTGYGSDTSSLSSPDFAACAYVFKGTQILE